MAAASPDSRAFPGRLREYAALVRVPNLFTAPPDVILGAAIALSVADADASISSVPALAVASMLLYAGGTTLNDYFDAEVDRVERPERPIPSGAVSETKASLLGFALLGAGGLVAAAFGTIESGIVALLIGAVVFLYDAKLKGGPVGFLAMGAARGLNVYLGVTGVIVVSPVLSGSDPSLVSLSPQQFVPLVVALYIAAVTYMANDEATGGSRRAVGVAAIAALGVAATVPVVHFVVDAPPLHVAVGVLAALAFLAWVGRALRAAYSDPAPSTVGPAVGACVLGLVVLDGAFAAVAGVEWAALALCFLLPAVALSRAFDVS